MVSAQWIIVLAFLAVASGQQDLSRPDVNDEGEIVPSLENAREFPTEAEKHVEALKSRSALEEAQEKMKIEDREGAVKRQSALENAQEKMKVEASSCPSVFIDCGSEKTKYLVKRSPTSGAMKIGAGILGGVRNGLGEMMYDPVWRAKIIAAALTKPQYSDIKNKLEAVAGKLALSPLPTTEGALLGHKDPDLFDALWKDGLNKMDVARIHAALRTEDVSALASYSPEEKLRIITEASKYPDKFNLGTLPEDLEAHQSDLWQKLSYGDVMNITSGWTAADFKNGKKDMATNAAKDALTATSGFFSGLGSKVSKFVGRTMEGTKAGYQTASEEVVPKCSNSITKIEMISDSVPFPDISGHCEMVDFTDDLLAKSCFEDTEIISKFCVDQDSATVTLVATTTSSVMRMPSVFSRSAGADAASAIEVTGEATHGALQPESASFAAQGQEAEETHALPKALTQVTQPKGVTEGQAFVQHNPSTGQNPEDLSDDVSDDLLHSLSFAELLHGDEAEADHDAAAQPGTKVEVSRSSRGIRLH